MAEEVLYQVTPDDQVLGSVTRKKAHQDPSLIHREVAVLLKDDRGKVLLAQRSYKKKVLPGKWDVTCAGHVPWGMATEDAAHMELQEEVGFDTPLYYVGAQLALYDWETHLTHLFVGRYNGEKIVLQETEVEAAELLDRSGVNKLGDAVNLEFREFIHSALEEELEDRKPLWQKEQDLRSTDVR